MRGLLALQVGVVLIAALYFGHDICIPVVLAVLLSFLLQPLNALLRRWHFGRWPSASLSILFALGLIAGLLWLIGMQAVGLTRELAANHSTIEGKLISLHHLGSGQSFGSFQHLREQVGQLLAGPAPAPQPVSASTPARPAQVEIIKAAPTSLDMAESLLARMAHPLATVLVVFIVSIFILLQREDLRDRAIRLFGTRDLHRTTVAIDDAGSRLSRYFLTQLAINAGFGCLIAGGLFLIGIPSPFLWGILAMLLRFIPYFGTLLAAVPPILLAAASFPGWNGTIETLALYLLVEPMVAQFIEPLLIGHSTGLSPISVVLAAAFWTWLWGPIGLILSTPLTLCTVVLGRHVERLEFLAVLLGDQPALSPVESFYQRMLADDPDEIEEQAEALLQEVALSTYYDDVVIPGLQLASLDVDRGVLEDAHLARMRDAITELVGELNRYPDAHPKPDPADQERSAVAPEDPDGLLRQPAATGMLNQDNTAQPAWQVDQPVLCVPGSGPLDEVAASILVQILAKHGIDGRIVPNEATSRTRIGTLDIGNPALICLCALGLESRLSPLRYTARRLRQQAPGIPIAVAFWPGRTPEDLQRRIGQALGVDHHAQSMRDVVHICLQAASSGREHARAA
ncbi:AI-2E family transporter [Lichenicola cladoniae]|uniref:AI-2E family transporter n=1 Tax=Lichenicola cladoniae TaxID=1484109 RepID=A0A6M8HJS1_9PROT|nr:AI-2E family transporter [Lichenicola cladoniae]NPD66715.1 AI-2E family transporter [Acetobacteraceae bacterium]QKE88666.1 AI-2E family transporter [Lichenicola cladoniae]